MKLHWLAVIGAIIVDIILKLAQEFEVMYTPDYVIVIISLSVYMYLILIGYLELLVKDLNKQEVKK